MTRDQLRAARILLRLRQDQLAQQANMGVATVRRFEGGHEISALRLKALREAVERSGAILLSENDGRVGATGTGVALLPTDQLPKDTRLRLSTDPVASPPDDEKGSEGKRAAEPPAKRRRGRPRMSGGRSAEPASKPLPESGATPDDDDPAT